jgi:hypothetical protein
MKSSLLPLVILTVSLALLVDDVSNPHAGIPIPMSAKEFRQPVGNRCSINQGNGGSFSHTDEHNRYAWDYDILVGKPVVAARAGVVVRVSMGSNIGGEDRVFLPDCNLIQIDHGDGMSTSYVHLSKNRSLVRLGEFVLQGELLGYSGQTGLAGRPHLHYTVIDSTGKSVSSRFVDFENRDGIPRKGDTVPAARKPALSQKIIESYKRYFRACVRADRLGFHDFGYAFTGAVPQLKAYQDYYYARVIAKKRAVYRAVVLSHLERLTDASNPGVADFEQAGRYLYSLSGSKDKEIKAALRVLRETRKAWQSEEATQWIDGDRAVRAWVEGIGAECQEDPSGAVKNYSRALRSAEGAIELVAASGLRRIIDEFRIMYLTDLERLLYESKKALAKDRVKVKSDAKLAWTIMREVIEAWNRWFPDDEAPARDALEHARSLHEQILTNLMNAGK